MRRQLGFDLSIGFMLVSMFAGIGCSGDTQPRTSEQVLTGCDTGDAGAGGGGGGADGGMPSPGGGPPADALSTANGEPLQLSTFGNPVAQVGVSWSWFPGNPGPNVGGIPTDIALGGPGTIFHLPIGGLLTARTQATSPVDTDARAGALGENFSFAPGADPSRPITVDLLEAGGGVLVPAGLINVAYLRFGAFAAQTSFVGGVLQPDMYRVAQADLVIGSPAVKDAAAALYQAMGAVDRTIEQIVNDNVAISAIQTVVGGVLPVPTLTVSSNIRDKIFAALLTQPLTSHNHIVTIDLSTGDLQVHLDQIVAGGLNNQPPNKELINSGDYPLLATTVHDVMHDATNIALGTIGNSLDAVTITLRWQGPVAGGLLGDVLDVSWTFNLKQAATGTMPPAVNNSTGLLGTVAGTTLVTTLNTLTTAGNAVGALFLPAYNLILADAGNGVFDLAINQIKFGFTSTVVNMLQPVFAMAAQIVSVQVNHQETSTCNGPSGPVPNKHSISALSIGLLQAANAARLDLGRAAGTVTIPNCN